MMDDMEKLLYSFFDLLSMANDPSQQAELTQRLQDAAPKDLSALFKLWFIFMSEEEYGKYQPLLDAILEEYDRRGPIPPRPSREESRVELWKLACEQGLVKSQFPPQNILKNPI